MFSILCAKNDENRTGDGMTKTGMETVWRKRDRIRY